jgi:hypothetical protein
VDRALRRGNGQRWPHGEEVAVECPQSLWKVMMAKHMVRRRLCSRARTFSLAGTVNELRSSTGGCKAILEVCGWFRRELVVVKD